MRWRIGAVLAVTLVCLAVALRHVDPLAAGAAMAGARVWVLGPVFALFTGTLVARAVRFRALLNHEVGFRPMLSVVAVSFLAINVVPLRMGELVRPYLLAEAHEVPLGTSLAALVLERLLDVCALLVLLGAVAWWVAIPGDGLVVQGVDLLQVGQRTLGALVVVLGGVAAGVVALGPERVDGLAGRLEGVVPERLLTPVRGLVRRVVEGFRALLAHPAQAALALACTAVIWVGTLVSVGVAMAGFPGLLPEALGPMAEQVLLHWGSTMTAMVLIPTPGFVGAFEAGSVGSLTLLGVSADLAGAFTLMLHLAMFAYTAGSGLLFAGAEGWSLVQVVRASQAKRTDPHA